MSPQPMRVVLIRLDASCCCISLLNLTFNSIALSVSISNATSMISISRMSPPPLEAHRVTAHHVLGGTKFTRTSINDNGNE